MIDPLTNLVWRVQDTPVLEIRYTLDALGRVTRRVDRSGGALLSIRDYGYDGMDRLASEARDSGYAAAYAYDDAGRRTAKETARFGVAYTAGTGDRLAGWEVTRTNTWTFQVSGFSSEAPATNPAYRFLEARNDVETVAPGMTGSNFTAALTGRTLGTQTVIVAISDAAGNVGVATSAFVRTAFTSGEYSADAAGCVTQAVWRGPLCERSLTLAWDAQYRLTVATTNGAPAESYGYDPLGRRMWTEAGGVTNLHLYDGAHLLADLDATGGVVRNYVYGPEIDERVAMTIHTGDVPRTFYALRDHQNTVWAWVDESGGVVESYDYDAWGRVLGIYDGAGASMAQSAIDNRFLFQGREYSFATGLYQFRARWYDPVTGRWLSNDPTGISGGLNQYVFCWNDPVNYIDPFGLCADYQSAIDAVKQNYDFGNPIFNYFAGLMLDWVGQSRQTQLTAQASGWSPATAYNLGAVQAGAGGAFASATISLVGLVGGQILGSIPALIPVASGSVAGPILQRGDGVLVAISPSGQVVTGNLGTSHAVFGSQMGVIANGQLISGAYIGTAFNSGGQIAVINSMTFFGNSMPATPVVQAVVRAALRAE